MDLPREIKLRIHKSTGCCKPTPEEAQKEPCACGASALIEQIEDWGDAVPLYTQEQLDVMVLEVKLDV